MSQANEDSLFAPSSYQKDKNEEEKSASVTQEQKRNLFSKKRTNAPTKSDTQVDFGNEQSPVYDPAHDALFAPSAVERTSVVQKRNLSQTFLQSIQANTVLIDKSTKQANPFNRGSIAANRAIFESNVSQSKPEQELRIKKITGEMTSEVDSNQGIVEQRKQIKSLVQQFQSNLSSNVGKNDVGFASVKHHTRTQSRKSLGDAFLESVNKVNKEKEIQSRGPLSRDSTGVDKERKSLGEAFLKSVNEGNQGHHGRISSTGVGNRNGRHSMGDQFLNSVNQNQLKVKDNSDDTNSQRFDPRQRSTNIFNKVRAIQAGQFFSTKSESDLLSNKAKNIFKQKREVNVDKDDGGVGAGLITADQMARNLIRNSEERKSLKQVDTAEAVDGQKNVENDDQNSELLDNRDTGILEQIDNQSQPQSPEMMREQKAVIVFADEAKSRKVSDVKPIVDCKPAFNLTNQLNQVESEAQELRSNWEQKDELSPRGRIVAIKKLGKMKTEQAERDSKSSHSKPRVQLKADIIVCQDKEAVKKAKELIEKSQTQNEDFATTAVIRENNHKRTANVSHDRIGAMVFAQEQQHVSQEREEWAHKLENEKKSARKISSKMPVSKQINTSPAVVNEDKEVKLFAQVQEVRNQQSQDESIDRTHIVSTINKSNMLESSREVKKEISQNEDKASLVADDTALPTNVIKKAQKRSDRSSFERSAILQKSFNGQKKEAENSLVNQSHEAKQLSQQRNNEFLQYVIGADTLLPKRVRSKKSDMPFSNSENTYRNQGGIDTDIFMLQKELEEEEEEMQGFQTKKRCVPKKQTEEAEESRELHAMHQSLLENPIKSSNYQYHVDDSDSSDSEIKYIEDEQMQSAEAKKQKIEDDLKYNSENEDDTPESSDSDEDQDDMDELERMIANQERMLNEFVQEANGKDQAVDEQGQVPLFIPAHSISNDSKQSYKEKAEDVKTKQDLSMIRRGNNAMANFLDDSKDESVELSGTQMRQQQLEELQHEIELDELTMQEQQKLEAAILQAQQEQAQPPILNANKQISCDENDYGQDLMQITGTDRSQLDFNDVSNIQNQTKTSQTDISGIREKVDAIGQAISEQKRPVSQIGQQSHAAFQAKRVSLLSALPSVSDMTDAHALRNNYLEQSRDSQAEQSSVAKNQREKQLKYELEILELELELQMNEAELTDNEEEERISVNQVVPVSMRNSFAQTGKVADGSGINIEQKKSGIEAKLNWQGGNQDEEISSFWGRSQKNGQMLPNPTQESVIPCINIIKKDKREQKNKEAVVVNINFEDQEVLCSNCYETIPMSLVDIHSMTCVKEDITVDEDREFQTQINELNDRIFKLIQTSLRKLDSQVFLDQIYNTGRNNEISSQNLDSPFLEEERGGNAFKMRKQSQQTQITPTNNRTATALAEERSLIHEVVQHAHLALQGDLLDVQRAAEELDQLEEEHDLNQKFDFNNHMVFNRILQVINIKLEVMQEYEKLINPDFIVPLTTKQMRQKEERLNFGFQELSLANVNKLPLTLIEKQRDPEISQPNTTKANGRNNNQWEMQLNEYIQASKVQAMQSKKKRNIFATKKANDSTSGQEHWILSDIDSDKNSAGGDSHSSFSSFSKPRFKAASVLKNRKQ